MEEIYLDNAATTKVSEEVVEAMMPFFTEKYGNASSLHKKGEETIDAINNVRKKIAGEIGCKSHEIIFTSGATEANNLALQGIVRKNTDKKKIIISGIEHPSVSEVVNFLEKEGYEIKRINVDKLGFLNFDSLEKEIDENTLLVSVMFVNNVFGTIQDIRKIGKLCRKKEVLFHTDAVQGFGKLKIDVNDWGIDMLSASGHKIEGPKGVGFLYVKEGIDLDSIIYGGGQERGIRSGTENIPGIIGMEKALELYKGKNWRKVEKIRNLFFEELEKIGGKINGSKEKRICNNIHVNFPGVDAEELIIKLSERGIFISVGSACDSKTKREDLILKAIGLSRGDAQSSMRISLSEEISEEDVKKVVGEIKLLLNFLHP